MISTERIEEMKLIQKTINFQKLEILIYNHTLWGFQVCMDLMQLCQ